MKRRLTPLLLSMAATLILCSSAQAAVTLSFTEAKHEQATINRGDESATYSVKLKNIGGDPTSGTSHVAIALPTGVELSLGTGSGWSCHLTAQTCSSSQVVAAGSEFPPLTMRVWIYPDQAPDTVTAGFTAFGGGTPNDAFAQDSFSFGPEAPFGIVDFTARAEDPLGDDSVTAGGHPFAATSTFALTTHTSPLGSPTLVENLRDLYFELPAGFVGNPEAADICAFVQVQLATCPDAAVVGGIKVVFDGDLEEGPAPLYRIEPEDGYPAAFAFRPVPISTLTVVLRAKLRSNGDYGVTAVSPLPPQSPRLLSVEFATLCGYGPVLQAQGPAANPKFLGCKQAGDPGAREVPFLTNPTKCAGDVPVTRVHADSYQNPGIQKAEGLPDLSDPNWKSVEALAPQNEGCEVLSEAWVGVRKPSLGFQPDSSRAAAPAGYAAHLQIPQDGLLEKEGLATAHLKATTVTLPAGVALNPSAADGLGACSLEQAGYLGSGFGSPNPVRFSAAAPGCPESSKVGVAQVRTPILGETLDGSIYLAAQDRNPFGSKFAVYLVVDDAQTGIEATLAGRVSPDPQTGRITSVFDHNPQAPIEDVEISFFGGPRASLVNPDVCGSYETRTELTPWSAQDPDHPSVAETAVSIDGLAVDTPAAGQSSCPAGKAERPFALGFSARSTQPIAGAHTPFALRLTRPEGSQEISGVTVNTPPGFAATLRGVASCSEAELATALAPGRTGAAELAGPSCPAASQIGTTTIGAGAGPTPYYVRTGKAYLAGPYKSAPLSLAFVVPAVAGPFDLGVQVVRTAIQVNPKTAAITAVSDPIPQILEGVPLQIRDIRVDLDRPGFSLNPTNCEAMAISAQVSGGSGAVANLANRFQVGGCENLKFRPDLAIQLHGGTKRADYQRLEATVTYPKGPGYANIARAAVTLPHSAFLAQEHIRTVCTRVQFAAKACPKGSVYGHATAITPLLDQPLSGPVYLRSSDNPLPDLVAALRGPDARPIEVELSGRTDSKDGGIRNTFDLVPDAPVSKFTLKLLGGKKSLIVNSRNLCTGKQRATVRLTAQNGMTSNTRPVVGNDCGKKAKKGKKGERRRVALGWPPRGF
jgi:hypothetical protein